MKSLVFMFAGIVSFMGYAQSAKALDVEAHVHNPCKAQGKQCFVMDVYLDGKATARFVTSPGLPSGGSFPGVNTPLFNGARFTSTNGPGYRSAKRRDAMPYAMHINGTGFAAHGGPYTVNGKKASHGCLRLKDANAKQLNAWVREAKATGGLHTITVQDTK